MRVNICLNQLLICNELTHWSELEPPLGRNSWICAHDQLWKVVYQNMDDSLAAPPLGLSFWKTECKLLSDTHYTWQKYPLHFVLFSSWLNTFNVIQRILIQKSVRSDFWFLSTFSFQLVLFFLGSSLSHCLLSVHSCISLCWSARSKTIPFKQGLWVVVFLMFQMKARYGILHRKVQVKNLYFQMHCTSTQSSILYSIFYLQHKAAYFHQG